VLCVLTPSKQYEPAYFESLCIHGHKYEHVEIHCLYKYPHITRCYCVLEYGEEEAAFPMLKSQSNIKLKDLPFYNAVVKVFV